MLLDYIRFVLSILDERKRADIILSDHVCVRYCCYRVLDTHFPVCASLLIRASSIAFLVVLFFPKLNVCCVLAFVFALLTGVIEATTSLQVGLNSVTELINGYTRYTLPDRPIAMMMFKPWGYITMQQGLIYTNDFKLGHYMKVPPWSMFLCQVVSTVVAGTVQLGVQAWMFSNTEDIYSPDQKDSFICPNTTVSGTTSITVSLSCGPYLVCIAQGLLLCCSGV